MIRALRWLDALPLTWALLALPAALTLRTIARGEHYVPQVLYDTGILSVQLTVAALAVTPLGVLLGAGSAVVRALRRRRRALGVAAFGYGFLHALVWVMHTADPEETLLEAAEPLFATGWLALAVLGTLAATSNRASQRRMGSRWKRLQRWAHVGLALVVLHWLLVGQFLHHLWPWLLPLLALQVWRMTRGRKEAT